MSDVQELVENDEVIFLNYGGFLSQTLIAGMTEALEQEAKNFEVNIAMSSDIYTIFIELTQNMMNYSKNEHSNSRDISAGGNIIVSKDSHGNYYIQSRNIVSLDDKNKMMPKLTDITTLDKANIKVKYKELRRSGKDAHSLGGGLGFYEIGKRCDSVKFNFTKINEDKYYFHLKTKINFLNKIKNN